MFIVRSLKLAADGWQHNPPRMVAQVVVSSVVGQGIFWNIGYDQLGIAMNPQKEFGLGQQVATKIYARIPHTRKVAWTLKAIEILTDFARGPAEGAVYVRHGITPDGLANLFTQPLWSTAEAVEKLVGAIIHPDRVVTEDGIKLSLACIYGSVFRLGTVCVLLRVGNQLDQNATQRLERLIRLAVDEVSTLGSR